jgi:uncharacterized RDD family membrane protein YckC
MENLNLAGVGKRIVALIIDWVAITIAQSIVAGIFFGGVAASYSSIFSGSDPDSEAISALMIASLWQNLASFVIYVLYEGLLTASERQGTLGKMAMKIKVVDEKGMRLTQGDAILRAVMKIVSGVLCCIGYFVALFNKQEQTLHDLVAKTYVVNE